MIKILLERSKTNFYRQR